MSNIRILMGALALSLIAAACKVDPAASPAATAPSSAAPASVAGPVKPEERTALDVYVAKPDPAYGWKLVSTIPGDGYKTYVLELRSQSWRKASEVDRPVWTHWLSITKPDKVSSDKAFLFIGEGSNGDPAPTKPSLRSQRIVTETNSVAAEVGMVPNQPLYFSDAPKIGRSEDDLIAYSRVQHFKTKDDEWLVRLAMVKSGVKAMDAVQEFLASEAGGKTKINQFVVAGGSKRGWTTWLIGAVDNRVMAIIPMVIDALNSEAITKHHFEVLGFFAPSLQDYVDHGLFPHKIGTPEYQAVLKIEDPYNYRNRARLKIPKFLINASGDQFFLPDNSQFYYGDMPEEKRIRYVENARHNTGDTDAVESLVAFFQSVITGGTRPSYSWTKAADGTLTVRPKDKPTAVKLWQAHNPSTRDFRVEHLGKAYTSSLLEPRPDGTYVAHIDKPASGFTAFFVELDYPSGGKYPFKFTTEVSIVPDVLPYKWADAAAKYAATKDAAKDPRGSGTGKGN